MASSSESAAPGHAVPGTVLAGKYRVERVLGQGGMGLVVEARHLALDERVALKFLLPEYLQNVEAAERFQREARAAIKIKSEHVARVLDVGTLETGAPYMVMEFLEGSDLANYIEKRGVLHLPDAVDFVIQGCEAIAEAHALGIVHRDLKPANLFLTRRPDGMPLVKVLDFGISKNLNAGVDNLTRTTAAMGSALYMSPEQMQQTRAVDHRTDIYALGISLYELIGGRQPFLADTLPQLCAAILTGTPTPIREIRPDVPEHLASVIARAYERDRAQRYQSIVEFVAGLAPYAPPRSMPAIERIARMAGIDPATILRASSPHDMAGWQRASSPPAQQAPTQLAPAQQPPAQMTSSGPQDAASWQQRSSGPPIAVQQGASQPPAHMTGSGPQDAASWQQRGSGSPIAAQQNQAAPPAYMTASGPQDAANWQQRSSGPPVAAQQNQAQPPAHMTASGPQDAASWQQRSSGPPDPMAPVAQQPPANLRASGPQPTTDMSSAIPFDNNAGHIVVPGYAGPVSARASAAFAKSALRQPKQGASAKAILFAFIGICVIAVAVVAAFVTLRTPPTAQPADSAATSASGAPAAQSSEPQTTQPQSKPASSGGEATAPSTASAAPPNGSSAPTASAPAPSESVTSPTAKATSSAGGAPLLGAAHPALSSTSKLPIAVTATPTGKRTNAPPPVLTAR